ncbi:MAG: FAD-dependent oxidoreductase [Desulfovibrionales bacterium]|nr:FAD-dependent oxidoreductase [Desulfovibrionales bacterium]
MYDVVIIGGGPAGLSAGLYAARAKMDTLILEKDKVGGQIVITHEIANYPGCVTGANDNLASGAELVERMKEQAISFGAELTKGHVVDVDIHSPIKTVTCKDGTTYEAKSVIVATGANPRPIGCPGEKELAGKGVSYCATCNANFYVDFEVFVIGGGDSAVEEALYLTKFARKVTVVHRRDTLRAAKSIQERAFQNPKISFLWDTVVEEIKGDGLVEAIVFRNKKTGEVWEHTADENDGTFGVFGFVGYIPSTEMFSGQIMATSSGYFKADDTMKALRADNSGECFEGVFVAGDCREKSLMQVVTAASDGAIAATAAEKYVEEAFAGEEYTRGVA